MIIFCPRNTFPYLLQTLTTCIYQRFRGFFVNAYTFLLFSENLYLRQLLQGFRIGERSAVFPMADTLSGHIHQVFQLFLWKIYGLSCLMKLLLECHNHTACSCFDELRNIITNSQKLFKIRRKWAKTTEAISQFMISTIWWRRWSGNDGCKCLWWIFHVHWRALYIAFLFVPIENVLLGTFFVDLCSFFTWR